MSRNVQLKAFLIGCFATVIAFFTLSSPPTILLLSLLASQQSFTIMQLLSAGSISLFSSPFSQPSLVLSLILIASLAIGVNILLMYVLWARARSFPRNSEAVAGFFAALFGIGCAACGPLFGASLLTSIGGASLVTLFPFGGQEIGYLGIGLLLFSAFSLYRMLRKPLVCP